MYKIVINNKNNLEKCIINDLDCADTFLKRLIGLMGKRNFNGMIFPQEQSNKFMSSIHTCFMKVPIDLIYVDNNLIIEEITTLKEWKLYIPKKGNIRYIIELPEKSIEKHNIHVGDKIVVKNA